MNTYARIRQIEDHVEFKRLINTLLGAEYGEKYQATKEWSDFGIDGYQKDNKTIYAVYCPLYPERRELKKYKDKIISDLNKLQQALKSKKVALKIMEWVFVTPDDLPVEIINLIDQKTRDLKWKSGTLTAQVLAPMFIKHSKLHFDFPNITAGLQLDKVPSISAQFVKNRGYEMLELFNDGTEDIKNMEVYISENGKEWKSRTHTFMFEFDDPMMGSNHSLYNLRKGERQYCNHVPTSGGFHFKITGVGVESNKTFIKEGIANNQSIFT